MSVTCRIFVLLCFYTVATSCATVITGNSTVAQETATFLFNKHAQDRQGSTAGVYPIQIGNLNFFGADASAAGLSEQYALSVIARDQSALTGISRQMALINGTEVDDPLYNTGIAFLSLMEGAEGIVGDAIKPVVVTTADLTTIYLVNRYIGANTELAPAPNVPDATAAVTSGIVGLAAANNYVFSAVKPNAGGSQFGAVGSGIVVTILGFIQHAIFGHLDGPTGLYSTTPRAVPFDVTSSFLRIGDDLASIGQIVDMYWDFITQRLYIALQVVGGASPTDGAIAVVVGYIETTYQTVDGVQKPYARILQLNPLAPQSAFDTAGNKIFGNIGANAAISINKVRTMQTSTLVNYLIVQGDVGAAGTTESAVYALPLVSGTTNDAINGTLAQKTATPILIINPTNNYVAGQGFETPAAVPADMPLNTDAATLVGAGPLASGAITDLIIRNDTVFATVATAAANFTPGIYYSTALFDGNAAIKGWTAWRRAITTLNNFAAVAIDSVEGALLDPVRGDFLVQTFNNGATETIIKRTSWGSGDALISEPLITLLSQQFPQGIANLVDTPYTGIGVTPALHSISVMIASGIQKIALIQTGAVSLPHTDLLPSNATDYANSVSFTNGAITTDFPTANAAKIVVVSGGALETIGLIQAAEIAAGGIANAQGYLFVGGLGGLAVLSRADGSGWIAASQLANEFIGLLDDMSFKIIGNYSDVRKLIADGNFLYVLTDTTLDRIDMTAGSIGLGTGLSITTVASATALGVSAFSDFLVTNKFALLGTTDGLLRVGDGADITMATNTQTAGWTVVALPDGAGPVTHLYPMSVNGRNQTLGTNAVGGVVYVVSAYHGNDSARLHRFAVAQVSAGAISDTTLQRIPDLFINPTPSYFVDFSQYIRLFATDGALFWNVLDGTAQRGLSLRALPAQINAWPKTAFRFLGVQSQTVPLTFANGSNGTSLVKNSATGGFMLTGSFGAYIQE
jgi:hypothetical protein